VLYLLPRVLAELGSGAIWVISFFVGFYAARDRRVGAGYRNRPEGFAGGGAILNSGRILREVLRDLLEVVPPWEAPVSPAMASPVPRAGAAGHHAVRVNWRFALSGLANI